MSADALLAIIAGRDTDGLYEIRWSLAQGMGQRWFHVTNRAACLRFIAAKSSQADVFIGAAPRTKREGGVGAIQRVWCLWADVDTPDALARLEVFTPKPSLVVRSGSGNNVHAWWALSEPLSPSWARRANRRLAHALGSDMKATDAARILRPVGSLNHKHEPPVRVTVELCIPGFQHEAVRESMLIPVARVVKNLPDPAAFPPRSQRPRRAVQSDSPLADIPSTHYYTALTGWEATTTTHVRCPLWDHKSNPAMMLYPGDTWFCFACGLGGGIYEFGAALWGLGTRGTDFLELRERLTDALVSLR